jgi:DNA (cytosine-5)-methyltransferase 1
MRTGSRVSENYGYLRKYDRRILTSSLRTDHSSLSRERFAETEHGKTEPISRFHKLDPNGVCNTIRAGTGSDRGAFTSPRPIHPFKPRCITVREAARLHSYPDWFRFHATKWHGFRQLGNSVPPLLSQAIAEEIMKATGRTPSTPDRVLELGNFELLTFSMTRAASYFGVSKTVISKRTRNIFAESANA